MGGYWIGQYGFFSIKDVSLTPPKPARREKQLISRQLVGLMHTSGRNQSNQPLQNTPEKHPKPVWCTKCSFQTKSTNNIGSQPFWSIVTVAVTLLELKNYQVIDKKGEGETHKMKP